MKTPPTITPKIHTNGKVNGYHAAVNDPFPQDDDVYIPSPDDLAWLANEVNPAPPAPAIPTAAPAAPAAPAPAIQMPSSANTEFIPLPSNVAIPAHMGATACPWLDAYTAFSKRWAPSAYDNYHEAVGLWVLSTVAARRVAFPQGKTRYTSLYIALLGRTSIWTKTTAAEVGAALIRYANLGFMLAPDEMTPQAFISHLSDNSIPKNWDELSKTTQQSIKQKIAFLGQKGWYYDEFGQKVAGIMKESGHMTEYRGLLRNFDDGKEQYEYKSVSRGSDLVERPYLALLANCTPADLQPYAGRGAPLWNDGFWARFAFVSPPEDADRNRGRFPEEERVFPPDLYAPLINWHNRLGVPDVNVIDQTDEDAGKSKRSVEVEPKPPTMITLGAGVSNAFYAYREALLDIVLQTGLTDLDGNYNRLPEKAMRIAALFASLQECNKISMVHWARAQEIAEHWRADLHNLYRQLTSGVEQSKKKSREEAILALLAKKGELSKRDIVIGVRGLSSSDAAEVLPAMVDMGQLVEVKTGKTSIYALAG